MSFVSILYAQETLQQTLGDLNNIGQGWIYDDLDRAVATAKAKNAPMFVLFR
jgi:hypothetical protein